MPGRSHYSRDRQGELPEARPQAASGGDWTVEARRRIEAAEG
jgi:hypothetical protein